MIAIILAAGKGRRFGEITNKIPKPLISIKGVSLIHRTLISLPKIISKCVIVIGHLGEMIKEEIEDRYRHMEIEYVYQNHLNGTGGALLQTKNIIRNNNRFLVVNADDIYSKDDLERLVRHCPAYGIAWREPIKEGETSILLNERDYYNGRTVSIPGQCCYVGVGAYVFDVSIFKIDFSRLANGELSIPHSLGLLSEPVKTVLFHDWHPVNNLKELEEAKKYCN